jgi:TonB family protein
VLQLFPNPRVERRRIRWGWLVVSLSLLAPAVYLLYPSVESLREEESTVAPSPAPLATPIQAAVSPSARPGKKAAMIAPKPIREVAPVAADSIRNRIDDEIPVYVTMRIGANGVVTGAEAAKGSDGIQAYLSQRALEAARQWRFRPARLGADAIPGRFTVRFLFQKSGVEWN